MREGKQNSRFNIILTLLTGAGIIAACIYMPVRYFSDNARFLSGDGSPVYIDTATLDEETRWDQRFVKFDSLCTFTYEDASAATPVIYIPCRPADTIDWMIAGMKHVQKPGEKEPHYGRIRIATAKEKKQIRMLTGKSARQLYIFDPGISPEGVIYRGRIMIMTGGILSCVFVIAGIYLLRKWKKTGAKPGQKTL